MQVLVTRDSAILQSAQASRPDSYPQSSLDSGGAFVTRIDAETSSRIFGILQYMNFPKLEENYDTHASDQSTGVLEIIYDKKRIKKIVDRGLIGTRTLDLLEDILTNLRLSQSWKKIWFEPPAGFDCIYGSMMADP